MTEKSQKECNGDEERTEKQIIDEYFDISPEFSSYIQKNTCNDQKNNTCQEF